MEIRHSIASCNALVLEWACFENRPQRGPLSAYKSIEARMTYTSGVMVHLIQVKTGQPTYLI